MRELNGMVWCKRLKKKEGRTNHASQLLLKWLGTGFYRWIAASWCEQIVSAPGEFLTPCFLLSLICILECLKIWTKNQTIKGSVTALSSGHRSAPVSVTAWKGDSGGKISHNLEYSCRGLARLPNSVKNEICLFKVNGRSQMGVVCRFQFTFRSRTLIFNQSYE
jgi:hypothetical protein